MMSIANLLEVAGIVPEVIDHSPDLEIKVSIQCVP